MGNSVVHRYQADIDATDKFLGDLYEEGGRGPLAKGCDMAEIGEDGDKTVIGKTSDPGELSKSVRSRDWNDYRVIARGTGCCRRSTGS
jgi:hypothetical protein